MSSWLYESYKLSAAERQRMDEERKRRLIDELRKELAGRRQKEICETRERLALMNQMQSESRNVISELAARARVIINNALDRRHEVKAREILAAAEDLSAGGGSGSDLSGAATLRDELDRLYREFDDALQRDQCRNFVMENVRSVLAEMNYKVTEPETLTGSGGPRQAVPAFFYLKTPDDAAVKLTFGLANAVHAEFVKADRDSTGPDREEVQKCRRWCADHDRMVKKLAAHDIVFNEYWRIEPDTGSACLSGREETVNDDDFCLYDTETASRSR